MNINTDFIYRDKSWIILLENSENTYAIAFNQIKIEGRLYSLKN